MMKELRIKYEEIQVIIREIDAHAYLEEQKLKEQIELKLKEA